jgi:hypothetical protein
MGGVEVRRMYGDKACMGGLVAPCLATVVPNLARGLVFEHVNR